MKKHKVNDYNVELLDVPVIPPEQVKGHELFPLLYNNCAIIARKKSGKTNIIYNIIKKCCDKRTNIVFFVSTIHKCPVYAEILKYCAKKKINVMTFTDIREGRTHILQDLLERLQMPEKTEEKEAHTEFVQTRGFGIVPVRQVSATEAPKSRLKTPKHFLIFDDVSQSLRDPSISRLLKIHRNIECRVLISTQNLNDFTPATMRQLDYCLLFRGLAHNVEKLEYIYSNLDLSVDLDRFIEMYRDATAQPFHFMYISNRDNTYRQNFDQEYEVLE